MDDALERAAKAVGDRKALAKLLGISHQAIYQWKRCPSERVLAVENLTGVSRSDLRPDIYPADASRSRAKRTATR